MKVIVLLIVLQLFDQANAAPPLRMPTIMMKPAPAKNFVGQVTDVADGDTITVDCDGRKETVRLWGIDAPEIKQPFGVESRDVLRRIVSGKRVSVHVEARDKYGRTVGRVDILNNRLANTANAEQVSRGMAWWYVDYAKGAREMEFLEGRAKASKLGLWASESPQPPWEYRRTLRAKADEPGKNYVWFIIASVATLILLAIALICYRSRLRSRFNGPRNK